MNIRRSSNDKVIAGVCGGIAKAIGASPRNVRIAFAVLVLFAGLSFITYLVAWILIPSE